jgi:hypothetical protein
MSLQHILLMVSMLASAATSPVDAQNAVTATAAVNCNHARPDTDADAKLTLQRVRARLVASNVSINVRASCARAAFAPSDDFFDCALCEDELIGLMRDSARINRDAANAAAEEINKHHFWNEEIEWRKHLHDYLSREEVAESLLQIRRSNLASLADVYEHAGLAKDLHEFASAESDVSSFGPTTFVIWARAVRSCNAWKFTAANLLTNDGHPVLCSADCGNALARFFEVVRSTSEPTKTLAKVAPFLNPELCTGGVNETL